MNGHEQHATPASPIIIGLLIAAGSVYLAAAHRSRLHDRSWPRWRSLLWAGGLAVTAAALIGPMPEQEHMDFRVHMLGHVLHGMLGPLLLVLGAPATLALRSLPVGSARRLSAVLRSRFVVFLTHPIVAAVLNVGGLWVLYRTDLYMTTMTSPVLHVVIHAHVFLAGYLFTAAIIGPDPAPRRAGLPVRAAVLVLTIAAHNILAKTIYAFPPAGVAADQAASGAQLMYYAGAPVEVAIIALLCQEWFRAQHRSAYGVR